MLLAFIAGKRTNKGKTLLLNETLMRQNVVIDGKEPTARRSSFS
jgi:hypothetical protein